MIHWYKTSKKGFTLFEILLVITIMAILAIAAMTSTINTQRQFVFLNNFKEIFNKIREVRMDAVTQKAVDLGVPEGMGIPSAYGLYIANDGDLITVTVFADLTTSDTQNGYDPTGTGSDVDLGQPYSFDATKYTLEVADAPSVTNPYTFDTNSNLTFLYSPTEIKVVASGNITGTGSLQLTGPYIILTLKDTKEPPLTKKISIFLRSGIAEAIDATTIITPAPVVTP